MPILEDKPGGNLIYKKRKRKMTFEKILTTFLGSIITFLLPYQLTILSLFTLVILNAIAKYLAVANDEDVRFWQVGKILERSDSLSYLLLSFSGYSIAILSVVLLEMVMFGGIGVTVGGNNITLTYMIILFCVSHVFQNIFKSVEDIVKHPIFNNLVEKMPKWLQNLVKPKTRKR